MSVLTVTSKGQITLRKEVMRHLGLKPGDRVAVDLLPEGKATLSGLNSKNDLDAFFGLLHDPDQPELTLEEIKEITAEGWAGFR